MWAGALDTGIGIINKGTIIKRLIDERVIDEALGIADSELSLLLKAIGDLDDPDDLADAKTGHMLYYGYLRKDVAYLIGDDST